MVGPPWDGTVMLGIKWGNRCFKGGWEAKACLVQIDTPATIEYLEDWFNLRHDFVSRCHRLLNEHMPGHNPNPVSCTSS